MSDDGRTLLAHERIANAAKAHPWGTIGAIIAFAASLASAWPIFVTASHYYYTASDAADWRTELERRMAWAEVRDLKRDAVVARNRVNECRIKINNKEAMSNMEHAVCDQYEDELRDAQRAYTEGIRKATLLSGTKGESK